MNILNLLAITLLNYRYYYIYIIFISLFLRLSFAICMTNEENEIFNLVSQDSNSENSSVYTDETSLIGPNLSQTLLNELVNENHDLYLENQDLREELRIQREMINHLTQSYNNLYSRHENLQTRHIILQEHCRQILEQLQNRGSGRN